MNNTLAGREGQNESSSKNTKTGTPTAKQLPLSVALMRELKIVRKAFLHWQWRYCIMKAKILMDLGVLARILRAGS
ncbi:hypothetical protein KIN20_027644 [Parelaphostrongylus tenuis]|uniref:Uncharacterized protein n=1 Tax=Parelaphostrongylus tenuis TaxID=148309 RepID=A0AAD5WEB1_PARTN|nr:hypothetical protein KIN20_027644 [Parelaphostrongylus tenuis]